MKNQVADINLPCSGWSVGLLRHVTKMWQASLRAVLSVPCVKVITH